jgi:DNA replication licensing factor MCM6
LAEVVQTQYYRFEPYLKAAIHEVLRRDFSQQFNENENNTKKEYFLAIYNLKCVEKIRSMRSDKIGKLISIAGTVTRSSEVKPELLYGYFICKKCNTINSSVEQQFQYTTPHVCLNATCTSNDFQLMLDQSVYVDWQRLRVQENADEIPAGSMPRCIDVICRNEIVENAKAGDKIIFTGTVCAVADTSGTGRSGETTVSGMIDIFNVLTTNSTSF